MLWVLKRTVSMRRFFRAHKTNVKIDGLENISVCAKNNLSISLTAICLENKLDCD